MNWYNYIGCFFAGMFLANVVPHFVHGISGDRFPTPFAHPPGKGLSSPTVNVVWALFNLVVGYILFRVGKVSSGNDPSHGYFLRWHRCNKYHVERAICKETSQVTACAKDAARCAGRQPKGKTMPLTKLDTTAALIVIDLQKGIVGLPTVHPASEIISRAAQLARAFRERGLPVVLVNVSGRAPGRTDAGASQVFVSGGLDRAGS